MGGKKRKQGRTLEEELDRPWCYYCGDERDFDDLGVLMDHMKAKHFKCHNCPKRMTTAGGLKTHVANVHKEAVTRIDNVLVPGRDDPNVEIYLMTGIPDHVIQAKRQAIIEKYHMEEVQRYAKTGNPLPGSAEALQRGKKQKLTEETPEERKAKARAFIARKKQEKEQAKAAEEQAKAAEKQREEEAEAIMNKEVNDIYEVKHFPSLHPKLHMHY